MSRIWDSVASHSLKAEALPALIPIFKASLEVSLADSKPARNPATILSPAPTELTSVPFGDGRRYTFPVFAEKKRTVSPERNEDVAGPHSLQLFSADDDFIIRLEIDAEQFA